jgi:hypothetical protein
LTTTITIIYSTTTTNTTTITILASFLNAIDDRISTCGIEAEMKLTVCSHSNGCHVIQCEERACYK